VRLAAQHQERRQVDGVGARAASLAVRFAIGMDGRGKEGTKRSASSGLGG